MMVYWASVGCIAGILFFIAASLTLTEDDGYILQLMSLVLIIFMSIVLGMRIEGGVF